jgi:hypothetical protein
MSKTPDPVPELRKGFAACRSRAAAADKRVSARTPQDVRSGKVTADRRNP